jgi:hypothetical protein
MESASERLSASDTASRPDADRAQIAAVLDRVDNAFGASIVYTIGGLSVLVDVVLLTNRDRDEAVGAPLV